MGAAASEASATQHTVHMLVCVIAGVVTTGRTGQVGRCVYMRILGALRYAYYPRIPHALTVSRRASWPYKSGANRTPRDLVAAAVA